MYRIEWIERLKSRGPPSAAPAAPISPVVISLGVTSLLTDISSEMVNSLLPAYVVLYLHLSPLQFGIIDGLYNGFAIALFSLLAGYIADRSSRQKEVALVGYGLSAVCKLLLLAVGTTYGWLLLVVGLDRFGKGIRAAPRDALISLNTAPHAYASAFSVHRAMDAFGSLLGPITAFALLAYLPGAFDAIWITSFFFGVLGVAALWLLVPRVQAAASAPIAGAAPTVRWAMFRSRRFVALGACGALLALTTISDGFVYLMLREKTATGPEFFPLLYVMTATAYMLLSIPVGRFADRTSRTGVFLAGYAVLIALYGLLFSLGHLSIAMLVVCVAMMGLYYAATEGILMALASAAIPENQRTSGIAVIATGIGLAKLGSSVVFGALWQGIGVQYSVAVFAACMLVAIVVSVKVLRSSVHAA